MKRLALSTALAMLPAAFAIAAGEHDHGHGHDHAQHGQMAVGMAGQSGDVAQTIDVSMHETDDGAMVFTPAEIQVSKSETVRFHVTNAGEVTHEFVLDTVEGNQKHKAAMAEMPDMQHDDPNAIRLEPGQSGDVIWTFTNPGTFEFACLIPGHYESGMHGPITVKP